jgi:ribonuclease-3
LERLEERIGYKFKNRKHLETALIHSSYANENRDRKLKSNERLEFLGDSVLGMICSVYLYKKYPSVKEGELTKRRSALVCESSLCESARKIGLGSCLMLGKGEESGGGRDRTSILADAFEALIGAIYLDGGEEVARRFINRFILREEEGKSKEITDYKTLLQEIVQKSHEEVMSYRLCDAIGPDHEKKFIVEVLFNSNVIGTGEGHSKKEAEQMAAKSALQLMGINV